MADHLMNQNSDGQKENSGQPNSVEESGKTAVGKARASGIASVSGLLPGLILLLLGIIFFLHQLGALSKDEGWQYFLVGLGVIFLIEAWVHEINPAKGRPRAGRIIAGFVLIITGLAFLFGSTRWWPLVLIVLGLILVLNFFLRRRKFSRD
jgi:hypothetical protein